jgi:hypothetical protein
VVVAVGPVAADAFAEGGTQDVSRFGGVRRLLGDDP